MDKVIQVYLGGLCRKRFVYKGKSFVPKPVVVSPMLLRGYTCPTQCGACCGSFSLDYLPMEQRAPRAELRIIGIDDRQVPVWSDQQADVAGHWCRHLDSENGRCRIYDSRPFACDFELIRLLIFDDKVLVTQKQYGRAWAMKRLDGERGALCEMLPVDSVTVTEVVRKLRRLDHWAKHFDVATCVSAILEWVQTGDHHSPLRIPV